MSQCDRLMSQSLIMTSPVLTAADTETAADSCRQLARLLSTTVYNCLKLSTTVYTVWELHKAG